VAERSRWAWEKIGSFREVQRLLTNARAMLGVPWRNCASDVALAGMGV
jgi:hypothetical protein